LENGQPTANKAATFIMFRDGHPTEIENAFARLSTGGEIIMPLGDYGFRAAFGWISDGCGVFRQLNLR
jgi:uncharacterized glyoxalase superfamily protein PhnB